jgi:hypothetical protein
LDVLVEGANQVVEGRSEGIGVRVVAIDVDQAAFAHRLEVAHDRGVSGRVEEVVFAREEVESLSPGWVGLWRIRRPREAIATRSFQSLTQTPYPFLPGGIHLRGGNRKGDYLQGVLRPKVNAMAVRSGSQRR